MDFDKTVTEINRFFDYYNEKLYGNQLEKPVIIIQSNSKHKNSYGWCSCHKIWSDKAMTESHYEITIAAEHLNRDIEGVIGTLLHEMVHLHNLQFNIKDTSRGTTYHNKNFKEVAEAHGLWIDYDKRIGWSMTSLQDEIMADIENLGIDYSLFRLARISFQESIGTGGTGNGVEGGLSGGNKRKSSTRKYVCPACGTIIRATKQVLVICEPCRYRFEEQE